MVGRPARPVAAGSRRLALVAAALLVVLVAVAAAVPRLDVVGDVDAVVVLGGGGGERLTLGTRLAAEHGVPLVLAGDTVAEGALQGLRCGAADGAAGAASGAVVAVHCAPADPRSTAGEARAVTVLATEHGWRRVAVVTTTFHVDRARTLFAQCLGRDAVDVTGAAAPAWPGAELVRRSRELVARAAAATVAPAC